MTGSKTELKVIHLSTGSIGGAGLAARRLNRALNMAGFPSKFYAPERKDFTPVVNEEVLEISALALLKQKFYSFIQKSFHKKIFFSLWSANICNVRTLKRISNPEHTVLHIHNWFNLFSQRKLIKLSQIGYRIVLTMHDERFFTGGCHYTFECSGFIQACNTCPRIPTVLRRVPPKNLATATNLAKISKSNIWFVAPSKWLLDEAKRSKILKDCNQLVHIPNTLGEPYKVDELKKFRSRISKTELFIGIAAMDPSSYVKGGDSLDRITAEVSRLGLRVKFLYLNQMHGNANLEFWPKIDYILSLSRAETSSNVILEGKLQGVPAIATTVGGVTELLDFSADIPISPEAPTEEVIDIFMRLLDKYEKTELTSSNMAMANYLDGNVQKHIKLYKSILAK
jgi:glycosyltransferase involved in cell wall biosynthesis